MLSFGFVYAIYACVSGSPPPDSRSSCNRSSGLPTTPYATVAHRQDAKSCLGSLHVTSDTGCMRIDDYWYHIFSRSKCRRVILPPSSNKNAHSAVVFAQARNAWQSACHGRERNTRSLVLGWGVGDAILNQSHDGTECMDSSCLLTLICQVWEQRKLTVWV